MKLNLLKKLSFAVIGILATQQLSAQCNPTTASGVLNINNVNTTILNGGDMWWDLIGQAKYEVPKGSGKNALFAGALWVGGLNVNGSLQFAGQTYRQTGNDYYAGPLDATGNLIANNCASWDRVFSVTKQEIEIFLNSGTISQNLRDWPGKGSIGANGLIQDLAPFEDANGDGVYNPDDGDYPKIKGHQALWYVFNDVGNIHSATNGSIIGIEVQVMAYAFSSNNQLDNSTFYDYSIIKKSPGVLADAYIGFFVDSDLGNPQDDYTASHSSKRLGIVYNGDALDEDNNGTLGYGVNPPAIAYKLISTPIGANNNEMPLAAFMAPNSNNNQTGMPSLATEYYNYLKGNWKDGTSATLGGNGYDVSSQNIYPYNYDMAVDSINWTECNNNNAPNDRKMLLSVGPINLNQNQVYNFTNAAIWVPNATGINCNNLNIVVDETDIVEQLLKDSLAANTLGIKQLSNKAIKVFPNPSFGDFTIELPSKETFTVQVYNLKGQLVSNLDRQFGRVQISNLANGTYHVSVKNAKEFYTSKLIVIN